jgi:hypothetical protein
VNLSTHLRAIVLTASLATLALALGLVTLALNESTAKTAPAPTLLPKTSVSKPAAAPHVKAAPIDPNLVAALSAGLPRSVARGLAAHSVVVVELTSTHDSVAQLAVAEARAGARLAGASFVAVDVDREGGDAAVLTRLLAEVPVAPSALVYQRPATLYMTLPGFNERAIIQQAAANAAPAAGRTANSSP